MSTKKAEREELEALARQNKKFTELTSDHLTTFFVVAVAITALPAFLFHTVKGLPIVENFIVYAVISAASAVLLTMSYKEGTILNFKRLAQRYNANTEEQSRNLRQEASLSSLWVNNLIFALSFFFLSFYMLQVDTVYNYGISMLASAGLVFFVAQQ